MEYELVGNDAGGGDEEWGARRARVECLRFGGRERVRSCEAKERQRTSEVKETRIGCAKNELFHIFALAPLTWSSKQPKNKVRAAR